MAAVVIHIMSFFHYCKHGEKPEKVGQKQKNTTAKELNQDLMYYEAIKPVLPS